MDEAKYQKLKRSFRLGGNFPEGMSVDQRRAITKNALFASMRDEETRLFVKDNPNDFTVHGSTFPALVDRMGITMEEFAEMMDRVVDDFFDEGRQMEQVGEWSHDEFDEASQ